MFEFNLFRRKQAPPLPIPERLPLSPEEKLISVLPEDEQEEFRRLVQMYEDLDQSPTIGDYSTEHGNLSPEQAENLDRYFALRKKAEDLLKPSAPLS